MITTNQIYIAKMRSVYLTLAIMLIAGIVSAIPEWEIDRNDPYLNEKLLNGSIVVDPPESHKRQSTLIASLCMDKNLQTCNAYQLTTTTTSIPVIVTGSPYGISSAQLYDRGYVLVLYRNANYQGETRVFRTTYPINNMADQGDFNDVTGSARIIYYGTLLYGVNLWEDSNFGARVSYVLPGNYGIMDGSGATLCPFVGQPCVSSLSIRADKLSSFEVMPGIKLELWKNANFQGNTAGNYAGPFPQYSVPYPVPWSSMSGSGMGNDEVSSFKVSVW